MYYFYPRIFFDEHKHFELMVPNMSPYELRYPRNLAARKKMSAMILREIERFRVWNFVAFLHAGSDHINLTIRTF